ncbi:MAG: hypothetical protein E7277_02590 [Lachnospiraceae bacterium]|nr:hypothetical protein [Lachnospiraceae bacterium]
MNNSFFYDAEVRLNYLHRQIKELETELSSFPPGHIQIHKDRKWFKVYSVINGKRKYLPKAQIEQAKSLARKCFLEHRLSLFRKESAALSSFLKHCPVPSSEAPLLQKLHLLNPDFSPYPKEISDWFYGEFDHHSPNPEGLRLRSRSGNIVRSKSELMIDEMLFQYHIPYHYEEQLCFPDGTAIYPDFKVYNLRLRRFQYWEHNGMMDNADYCDMFHRKLRLYTQNGFYPQIDLIMTSETAANPLDMEQIHFQIKQLLP